MSQRPRVVALRSPLTPLVSPEQAPVAVPVPMLPISLCPPGPLASLPAAGARIGSDISGTPLVTAPGEPYGVGDQVQPPAPAVSGTLRPAGVGSARGAVGTAGGCASPEGNPRNPGNPGVS